MKRKFLSVLFALVLVLSFSLIPAVPAMASPGTLSVMPIPVSLSFGGGMAEWSIAMSHTGSNSIHLKTTSPDPPPPAAEARAGIMASSVGVYTLADIDSISWWEYLVQGYPPHVDIGLDIDGNGSPDDWLVIEYAYNTSEGDVRPEGQPSYGALTGAWYQTFSDDTLGPAAIDDGAYAWLTSQAAGPVGGEFGADGHYGATLADWKAGQTVPEVGEISASTVVTHFAIEVDNWRTPTVHADVYVDDIAFNVNGMACFGSIQYAIDEAEAGDTISVTAGTYYEQVVIDKSLTLQGTGRTTVIQPSGPELMSTTGIPWFGGINSMAAIVSVEATGDEVTIRDLKIDGSLITTTSTTWVAGLVYLETSGTIEDLTIIGYPDIGCRSVGIWASALIETALVEVTECDVIDQNRAGIYAYGATITADYHHNEINGPGELATQVPNGFFFLEGAKGSATYNTITDMAYDGETYRSSGVATYRPGDGVTFGYNEIYNVQNAIAIAGGSGATIEYNDIHDCHTGVKLEAIGENRASNTNIQYNDIVNNDFAIRCGTDMGDGNEAHYNNFVGNLGAEWVWVDDTWIGAVCNVHEEYDLDATKNWWGNISGPKQAATNPRGEGDEASAHVLCKPWLTRDFQTVLDDNIAYFGYTWVNLSNGWNLMSTPIALDPGCDTWGEYVALGDPDLHIHGTSPAYSFNAETQAYEALTGNSPLKPCDAILVRMAEPDIAPILFSPVPSAPAVQVEQGWNLVGLSSLEDLPVQEALTSLYKVAGDLTGYSLVVSPPMNQAPWTHIRDGEPQTLEKTRGYWVFMENGPDTLAGFTFTPMSLVAPAPAAGVVMEVSFQWYPVTEGSAGYSESYDDGSFTYTLPWSFPFAGKDIVSIEVSSNGLIELFEVGEPGESDDTVGNSFDYMMALAGDYPDSDIIFAWFDDLDSGTYGFYGVEYVPANDVVVVHWETPTCSDDDPDYMNYFQLWLFPDGSIKWNFKEFNYEYFGYDLGTGIYDSTSHTLFNVAYAMGEPDLIFNTPEKSYEISGEYMP